MRASQDIFPHKEGATRQLNLLLIVLPSLYIEERDFDSLQRHTKISDKLELKISEDEAVEVAQCVQALTTKTACLTVRSTEPTWSEERTDAWELSSDLHS